MKEANIVAKEHHVDTWECELARLQWEEINLSSSGYLIVF